MATAVNRREQLQRLERMYNSTEKERRLKAMRVREDWIAMEIFLVLGIRLMDR